MKDLIKRYRFFIVTLFITATVALINIDTGIKTVDVAWSSLLQMLEVLPPIMVMLGLIDVWVSREKMMKYMGVDSGLKGIVLSIFFASIAAGPMYAAFPFIPVLIKKEVKFSNIILFLNAWCVIKISTLLFEISGLGFRFTCYRFIIDLPGIIIMSYLIEKILSKKDLDLLYNDWRDDTLI